MDLALFRLRIYEALIQPTSPAVRIKPWPFDIVVATVGLSRPWFSWSWLMLATADGLRAPERIIASRPRPTMTVFITKKTERVDGRIPGLRV